ncbi:branched-chain amino acid transaminase [candidate division KSB1 bacterium]|nr:branched-chain amino acid transaminase [candidate division KSB1 bacterium]
MKISAEDEKGKIWFNGKMVDWKDATIHVMSHVLHYGSSVFEGMRCYNTHKGPAIFRLKDHIRRLFESAKIYRFEVPFTPGQIEQACIDVIKTNQMQAAYLRPLVFRGYGAMGVSPLDCPVDVVVASLNWGKYLGEEALTKGVKVGISSWNRIAPNTLPALAKVGANYMNSQLIRMEANRLGYAEGIALDQWGHISEGSGENIFLVRDGRIYTPPFSSSLLPGITRDCAIKVALELGYQIVEATIPREMIYICDEAFFTGTAAEVSPICSVDQLPIGEGCRGPVTENIQKRLFEYIECRRDDKYNWLTFVK